MKTTVTTSGFAELDAALAQIEKTATAKAAMRRSLEKAAQPIADMAAGLAPVDRGALQASVAVGTKLSKRQSAMHRKMFKNDKAAVEIFVGAGALSSSTQQEFGNEHNAPQPFMRPAWDAEAKPTLERLGKEMWADIKRTAERAAKKAAKG